MTEGDRDVTLPRARDQPEALALVRAGQLARLPAACRGAQVFSAFPSLSPSPPTSSLPRRFFQDAK